MALSDQREQVQDIGVKLFDFLVPFQVCGPKRIIIKSGKMRCKNQRDEESAKASLKKKLLSEFPEASKIKFDGDLVNETLEREGDDILSSLKRNAHQKASSK